MTPASGLAYEDLDLLGGPVLLVGEGDFSFAEALSRLYPSVPLVASTNLATYSDPRRISRLQSRGVICVTKVDARRLEHLHAPLATSVVIWNFPFLDVDEDTVQHHVLLRDFFHSLSLLRSRRGFPTRVGIALCNDQFSRWRVAVAGESAREREHSC
jgi:hypothetical protein